MATRTPAGAATLQPHVTAAITEAVLHEWADKGYARLSMEAVARRAGVGKSALYRRWPSKQDMALAVLDELRVAVVPVADTGSFAGDVEALMGGMREWLSYPRLAPILADMIAETTRDPRLRDAVDELLRRPQRSAAEPMFERAVARGELATDVDPDLVLELLVSNLYWRAIVRDEHVTNAYVRNLIGVIQRGCLPLPAAR